MTPLPPPLGRGDLVLWRLDQAQFAPSWDSGEGSYLAGGRWNSRGRRAVYAALDPATSILEVAVHKTFRVLDTVPHVLTAARLLIAEQVHVLNVTDIPNPHWLHPGAAGAGQQAFGDALLMTHRFVLMPSVVSAHSWTAMFDPALAKGYYAVLAQERFALDPRLHPPG